MVFNEKEYFWRNGYSPSIDANVVGAVCEEIETRDGKVTREAFLDASRSKDSATHNLFIWDDHVAAEKQRLDTARCIINHLSVTIKEPENKKTSVSAFVNVNTVKRAKYINVVDALSKPETRETVLKHAISELQAHKAKYETLHELSGVYRAMDEVIANV